MGAGVCGDDGCAAGTGCRARGGRGERRAGHSNLGLRNGYGECTLRGDRGQGRQNLAGVEGVVDMVAGGLWFVARAGAGVVEGAWVKPAPVVTGDGDDVNACNAITACVAGIAGRACVVGDVPVDRHGRGGGSNWSGRAPGVAWVRFDGWLLLGPRTPGWRRRMKSGGAGRPQGSPLQEKGWGLGGGASLQLG